MTKQPSPLDHAAKLVLEINGSCGPHIVAGINGNLPDRWRASGLQALPTHRQPGVAVFVSADNGRESVGAKLEVDAPHDHLMLADALARQLCERIKRAGPPRVRFALDPGATMPTRGSAGASGYDLYCPSDVLIRAGQVVVIHSGVHLELPDETWEAQIRPRSGMSKRGLWVSVGTVDSDYRGVVGATVVNLANEDQKVSAGERYAQLVLARVAHPEIETCEVADLTDTTRGASGFGSTGR